MARPSGNGPDPGSGFSMAVVAYAYAPAVRRDLVAGQNHANPDMVEASTPTCGDHMNERIGSAARTVGRIDDRRRLGPDEQVDDKAMVFAATDPALTDPFLFLSEDWFSKPGFDWHPHRGIETVTT